MSFPKHPPGTQSTRTTHRLNGDGGSGITQSTVYSYNSPGIFVTCINTLSGMAFTYLLSTLPPPHLSSRKKYQYLRTIRLPTPQPQGLFSPAQPPSPAPCVGEKKKAGWSAEASPSLVLYNMLYLRTQILEELVTQHNHYRKRANHRARAHLSSTALKRATQP